MSNTDFSITETFQLVVFFVCLVVFLSYWHIYKPVNLNLLQIALKQAKLPFLHHRAPCIWKMDVQGTLSITAFGVGLQYLLLILIPSPELHSWDRYRNEGTYEGPTVQPSWQPADCCFLICPQSKRTRKFGTAALPRREGSSHTSLTSSRYMNIYSPAPFSSSQSHAEMWHRLKYFPFQ